MQKKKNYIPSIYFIVKSVKLDVDKNINCYYNVLK